MREAQGLTMEGFARVMNVSLNTVSRWENSAPPVGGTLERLYKYAKKHGPAMSAATLLDAMTREKSEEFQRVRMAQVLDPLNVNDLRVLLHQWWQSEDADGGVDPVHNAERREYFLQMADRLHPGGRTAFLGENE